VFIGVVAGFLEPARIQENQQRRFFSGKAIFARKARAGLEATANLGIIGAGQKPDDAGFPALRLAEEPKNWNRRALDEHLKPFVVTSRPRRCQFLQWIEHSCSHRWRLLGPAYPWPWPISLLNADSHPKQVICRVPLSRTPLRMLPSLKSYGIVFSNRT